MKKKVALLLGNGHYATDLHRKLYNNGADLAVSLYTEGRTIFDRADLDECFDIFDRKKIRNYLEANGVTHVVFGGDFRQEVLEVIARERNLDDVVIELRASSPSVLVNRLGDELATPDAAGKSIKPIAASKLLSDLSPGTGWITRNGVFLNWTDAQIKKHVAILREKAMAEYRAQPWHHTRQAFLFDGEELSFQDQRGTDALLLAAAMSPRPGAIRALVKLCPEECNPNWDPPVIGPRTFGLAINAFVHLAIVDAKSGILFERGETLRKCNDVRISMYGA